VILTSRNSVSDMFKAFCDVTCIGAANICLDLIIYLTYLHVQEILGGQYVAVEKYNAHFFQRFRSENIVALTVDFARVGCLLYLSVA